MSYKIVERWLSTGFKIYMQPWHDEPWKWVATFRTKRAAYRYVEEVGHRWEV